MIDVFCKVAKKMKLKHVCRETITECIDKIIADNKK
jgi:hypothetical protein